MKLGTQHKTLLAGATAFIACTALAIAFYPHYDFWGQFFSELGVWRASKLSAFFFNSGLALTALFLAVFFFSLKNKGLLRTTTRFLGAASAFALIGVAVFSLDSSTELHYFFALAFFAAFGLALACLFLQKALEEKAGKALTALFAGAALSAAMLAASLQPWAQKATVAFYGACLLALAFKE
ncbi:MAG: DUF998 domain-containing protein [Candidatus Micrarchaeia archaeon]|jgi:hypothetical membrane protein